MADYQEISLKSEAKTLEKAFSLIAVEFSKTVYKGNLNNEINKSIMFRSQNLKYLLYNYINKLNELLLNECFILSEVQDLSINMVNNDYMLSSVVAGSKIKGNEIDVLVKEISKNVLIKEDKDGCHVQISLLVEEKNEI
ncbi:archease [Candidatus Woesearchaeota archaeon]|nr:MAG: hypothetical protein QT09_C0016G0007 [archaeon GW2011_AR18]MBS3161414.1 archease [Candidatus Woesearchaeota archaeon]HIH25877.1 archease [Nanoarchaeota archaeon]